MYCRQTDRRGETFIPPQTLFAGWGYNYENPKAKLEDIITDKEKGLYIIFKQQYTCVNRSINEQVKFIWG